MKDPSTKSEPWADPGLWEDRIESYRAYHDVGLKDAVKFGQWYSGQMGSLQAAVGEYLGGDPVAPLSNHININTQAALSELFFRAPTFMSSPQPQFGPPFGEKLARIESRFLNDWIDESDFFNEGRKVILDGLLSPMMIFEVGYTTEPGVDEEMVRLEREHAQVEDMTILKGGRPTVKKTDLHPIHIEQHQRVLADIEKGVILATEKAVKYLKKHLAFHEDAATEGGERPLETVRHDSIFGERVAMSCFACDTTSSSAARRRWVGKWYLKPIDEVRNNQKYDKEARKAVEAADFAAMGGEVMKAALRVTGDDEIEDQALIFEGVDLQFGKVIRFAQGADKALLTVPYREWRIRPGGPYITAEFVRDPLRDCGVAPPRIYEGHQIMVSYTDTMIASTGRRCVPQMAAMGSLLTTAEMDKITKGIPASLITLGQIPPNMKLSDVIQRIPVPEASDFLFQLRALHERGAERYSGIGSAKSGGGDFSKTATASAIVNDAVTNLADDRRAVLDNFMSRIARDVLRLGRKWYTRARMADIAGMEALDEDGWPWEWSDRDIARDKGVHVVPGSSRRKDSAVELKLNTELLSVVAKLGFAPPPMMVDLLRRVMDSAGIYAVDTAGLSQAAAMQEIEGLMGGGQAQPGQEGGPTKPERRGSARGEGTQAAVNQGAQNVGGGRMPTGASNGDKPRMMR